MLRRLPTFEEPRFMALVIFVVIATGLSALLTLGRQEDPTITNIYATVTTTLPGADPSRVEAMITTELEAEITKIPEVALIESASLKGTSVVNIELDQTLDEERIQQVWVELRNAVEDARQEFPDEALEPDINTEGISAYSAVIGVTLDHPRATATAAAHVAESLADRLRAVPGTRVANLFGVPEEEVLVSVDPYEAAALGIRIDEIASRISNADGKVLAGQMVTDQTAATVSVSGEIEALNRIRTIPLRDNVGGQGVQVGDIARVTRGAIEPPSELARADGKPAILVAVLVKEGMQIDRWMEFVRDEVERASAASPQGMGVRLLFDQSVYTVERLQEVGENLLIGMGIVILVLFFTLGIRAAAIVALILPLVSLATIATLSILNVPLHQMSITGLIVSLGLVVDAAIVMTDTVRRRLAEGLSRSEAAARAARRLFMPLAASTVTTILSFMPMILLPGPTGDFVGAIAISVAVMLTWSFVLAMLVTSALSGLFLSAKRREVEPGRRSLFHWPMRLMIRNPIASMAIACILPVVGVLLALSLTPQFFPAVERNQFHMEVELPGHSSILETERVVAQIDAKLAGIEGIQSTYWGIGRSAPSFYYNVVGRRSNEPRFAQAMVTTESPEDTLRILDTLQTDLDTAFPDARVIVRRLVQGPPVDAPVELRIIGPDIDVLRQTGAEVQRILAAQEGITQVRTGVSLGLPQIRYNIDSFKAQHIDLDEVTIARQLEAGLSGATGGSLVEGTDQIPIRVRFDAEIRGNSALIGDLPIVFSPGLDDGNIPAAVLSSVATPELEASEAAILRRNGERQNLIQGFLHYSVLPEQALQKALTAIEDAGLTLPDDYRLELGGSTDERGNAVRNLLASLSVLFILMTATLMLTYRSLRLTTATGVIAILCGGLSLFSLAVAQYPFGINALIGMIGSIGVSINAAIIVFTALQENDAAAAGDVDAGADEVLRASRHIISTTLTTFGGFLPLILSGGLFWPPFAVAVAGGVLLSATLAYLFTPAFFFMFYASPRRAARAAAEREADANVAGALGVGAGAGAAGMALADEPLEEWDEEYDEEAFLDDVDYEEDIEDGAYDDIEDYADDEDIDPAEDANDAEDWYDDDGSDGDEAFSEDLTDDRDIAAYAQGGDEADVISEPSADVEPQDEPLDDADTGQPALAVVPGMTVDTAAKAAFETVETITPEVSFGSSERETASPEAPDEPLPTEASDIFAVEDEDLEIIPEEGGFQPPHRPEQADGGKVATLSADTSDWDKPDADDGGGDWPETGDVMRIENVERLPHTDDNETQEDDDDDDTDAPRNRVIR